MQDYQVATDKNPATPTTQLDVVQYFAALVFHFEGCGRIGVQYLHEQVSKST